MQSICEVCSSIYRHAAFTPKNLVPRICSEDCLKEYIMRTISEPTTCPLFDLIYRDGHFTLKEEKPTTYRSTYEERLATWLEKNKINYAYEAIVFNREYLIDFVLIGESAMFIEVKGLWQPGAQSVVNRCIKHLGGRLKFNVFPKSIIHLLP